MAREGNPEFDFFTFFFFFFGKIVDTAWSVFRKTLHYSGHARILKIIHRPWLINWHERAGGRF